MRTFKGARQILDQLDRIGYKDVNVSDLAEILAQNPPMMKIVGYDEDTGGPKYLNGFRIDQDDVPIFVLYFSEYPKANPSLTDVLSHDEKVAEQRNKGIAMHEKSVEHMKFS